MNIANLIGLIALTIFAGSAVLLTMNRRVLDTVNTFNVGKVLFVLGSLATTGWIGLSIYGMFNVKGSAYVAQFVAWAVVVSVAYVVGRKGYRKTAPMVNNGSEPFAVTEAHHKVAEQYKQEQTMEVLTNGQREHADDVVKATK